MNWGSQNPNYSWCQYSTDTGKPSFPFHCPLPLLSLLSSLRRSRPSHSLKAGRAVHSTPVTTANRGRNRLPNRETVLRGALYEPAVTGLSLLSESLQTTRLLPGNSTVPMLGGPPPCVHCHYFPCNGPGQRWKLPGSACGLEQNTSLLFCAPSPSNQQNPAYTHQGAKSING